MNPFHGLRRILPLLLLLPVPPASALAQPFPSPVREADSAEARRLAKPVLATRLLDDMESPATWTHFGPGELSFTTDRARDGRQSIRLTSPTKTDKPGPVLGRPFAEAGLRRTFADEDWTGYNRLSVWVYPTLPGFKTVSLLLRFAAEGSERWSYTHGALNFVLLKNGQWNHVVWEIPHLDRRRVRALDFVYRLQGNEPEATNRVCFDLDHLELQRVEADPFVGWQVAPGALAYSHVGYLPQGGKVALASGLSGRQFRLLDAATGRVVLRKPLERVATPVGEFQRLDFSDVVQSGTYVLEAGALRTPPFPITSAVWRDTIAAELNLFYCQRCGTAVPGIHDACHRDWQVAHGDQRIVINGGWHDAGDYNKYVVNAGVTVGTLFRAWEDFRPRLEAWRLDLPESGGRLPEFLAELKWELDWLLTMQAPDGSVYHKVSTLRFGAFQPPEAERTARYFAPWSSAATADFVAMTALAARHFRAYEPAFADRCLAAAGRSYRFLTDHPAGHRADLTGFSTGAYQTGDTDDRLWAAAELWETTGDLACLRDFEQRLRRFDRRIDTDWDWGNVKNLGLLAYLFSSRSGRDATLVAGVRGSLLATAHAIVTTAQAHGYGRPLGTAYYWGCNGSVARQTLLLQAANRVQPDPAFLQTALDAVGYLLGRNCYGRSFVTGVGLNPPRHPHDRRNSISPGSEPWPGYLVGGGWPGAKDWVDDEKSYQTNEIAINWNAALIYALAGFLSPASGS